MIRPCPECGREFDDRGEPPLRVCSVYCQGAAAREEKGDRMTINDHDDADALADVLSAAEDKARKHGYDGLTVDELPEWLDTTKATRGEVD